MTDPLKLLEPTPLAESGSIPAGPPANPGLDYERLREEGVRSVQRLSGAVWTDYNESDPGVTVLEQLCYALTELSYRAELPVVDLLASGEGGTIDPRRHGLYPARRIFPVNPVTVDDYRKLLLDRVEGLANVWLEPYRPSVGEDPATGGVRRRSSRAVDGLYDAVVYGRGVEPPECDPEPEQRLEERVRRVYAHHRDLCEDLRAVRVLQPVGTVVVAEVAVAEAPPPEEILAGILFRVGLLLAPEPARHSLASREEAGMAPSEIFDGPLLLNGFIDDADLQPRAEEIPLVWVLEAIAAGPGVLGVSALSVRVGDREPVEEGCIPVPPDRVLRLDTRCGRRGYSIRLRRNGVPVEPDPDAVERELRRLWRRRRRTWPLAAEYEDWFAVPRGELRRLEQYTSVQDQFPTAYGINAYGLPGDAPVPRQARAKQLKGYLLVFDQLMADFFAQLEHVKDLFSIAPRPPAERQTYWYRYLDALVPDVEPLLETGPDGYHRGLPRLVASQDPYPERRGRFLAFLLGLYAQALDGRNVVAPDAVGVGEPGEGTLVAARLRWLQHLLMATRDRGRGFDVLVGLGPRNVSGMEVRCRIQLGLPARGGRAFAEVLAETGVEVQEGTGDASLDWHGDLVEEAFEPVPPPPPETARGPWLGGAVPEGGRWSLPEELLDGGEPELRVGHLPGDGALTAACRVGSGWWRVGRYADRTAAESGCHDFAALLEHLREHHRQLYLVEHLLLRYGRFRTPEPGAWDGGGDGGTGRHLDPHHDSGHDPHHHHHHHHHHGGENGGFVYDFSLTAVFLLPKRLRRDRDYRAAAAEVVRSNAPAHVAVDLRFLGPLQGRWFEHLHRDWRLALRNGGRRRRARTSARLRHFLQRTARGRED